MAACPACGSEVASPALECPRCHLSVGLFEAVREAVGVAESDPRYASEVQELLKAVESAPEGAAAPAADTGPGVLAYPFRFPAPSAPGSGVPAGPRAPVPDAPTPPSLDGLPALPALPSGGTAGLRRQLEEYLRLGRAMGLDLSEAVERDRAAIAADDRATLERVDRELFVRIAAGLAEEFETTVARRNGLATLVNTAAEDAELVELRALLLAGDLAGSQPRLAKVRERLEALEEEYEAALILVADCELLADTIRELGGDPGPALGPLEEGRRLLREGDRAEADAMLARGSIALWAVLYPRLAPALQRLKDVMIARRDAGEDVAPAVEELRGIATQLKRRNFAAVITHFRRLRALVGEDEAPAPAEAPSPSPAPR